MAYIPWMGVWMRADAHASPPPYPQTRSVHMVEMKIRLELCDVSQEAKNVSLGQETDPQS